MRRLLILATALSSIAHHVHCWGKAAHYAVTADAVDGIKRNTMRYIASVFADEIRQLQTSASRAIERRKEVRQVLVDASMWADTIDSTRSFHFTHTPYRSCSVYDHGHDCKGKCLVAGLKIHTARAADPRVPVDERKESLKYVVHLVADATQPLHTGFLEDAGGNGIHLSNPIDSSDRANPRHMSLHELWDHFLVNMNMGEGGFRAGVEHLTSTIKKQSRERYLLGPILFDRGDFPEAIVSNTVTTQTCRSAYRESKDPGSWIEDRASLSDDYLRTRAEVVVMQLTKASVWLTQTLDFIAKEFGRKVERSPKPVRKLRSVSPRSAELKTQNRFISLDPTLFPEGDAISTAPEGFVFKRPVSQKKPVVHAIDFNQIALVKRAATDWLMTDRESSVIPNYTPDYAMLFDLLFGTRSVMLAVDNKLISGDVTARTITMAFMALKGKQQADVASVEPALADASKLLPQDWIMQTLEFARSVGIRSKKTPFTPTTDPHPLQRFASLDKDDQIVFIINRAVSLVMAVPDAMQPTKTHRLHCYTHFSVSTGQRHCVFVDDRLAPERLSSAAWTKLIVRLDKCANNASRASFIMAMNPWLQKVLAQLNALFSRSESHSGTITDINYVDRTPKMMTLDIVTTVTPHQIHLIEVGPILVVTSGQLLLHNAVTTLTLLEQESHPAFPNVKWFVDFRLTEGQDAVNMADLKKHVAEIRKESVYQESDLKQLRALREFADKLRKGSPKYQALKGVVFGAQNGRQVYTLTLHGIDKCKYPRKK